MVSVDDTSLKVSFLINFNHIFAKIYFSSLDLSFLNCEVKGTRPDNFTDSILVIPSLLPHN